ncbi:hypothetical protein [Azospirillum sp. B4]|uniref:hypothetical protein n=1 Tax=Azospirillum sp. B4 TaxID=95605 RepID=UPI0011DC9FC8|nr:hypothetical protein [Azospirillum sp. B4]
MMPFSEDELGGLRQTNIDTSADACRTVLRHFLAVAAFLLPTATACAQPSLSGAEQACALLHDRYQLECAKDNFLLERNNVPFLDRTGAQDRDGFFANVANGITVMGDMGMPASAPVLVFPDGAAIPLYALDFVAKHKVHAVEDDYGEGSPIWKTHLGVLGMEGDDTCYIFPSALGKGIAEYCIPTKDFRDWRSVTADAPADGAATAFDDASLTGISVSDILVGKGTLIALHHPSFRRLGVTVTTDGDRRIVKVARNMRPSSSDTIGLSIKSPGSFIIDFEIDAKQEEYILDVTDQEIQIRPNNGVHRRFYSLHWQRQHRYTSTSMSIYCAGTDAAAADRCRVFSPIAGKFGALKSENAAGYFTHAGWNAVPSFVATYEIPPGSDVDALKAALQAALPDTDDGVTYRFFIEWKGPAGMGYCNHRQCGPLSEEIANTPVN